MRLFSLLLKEFELAGCRGRCSRYPSQNTTLKKPFASIVLVDWSTSRHLVVSSRGEAGSRERGYNLKALDTFSNCQRPVFSFWCVSTYLCAQNRTPVTIWTQYWVSKLRDNNGRKKYNCHPNSCALRCLILGPQ